MFRKLSTLSMFALLAVSVISTTNFSFAEEPASKPAAIKWHTKPAKAMAAAKKAKAPVFMLFTGKGWCGFCVKLEKKILGEKKFKAWAKKNKLVLVELDFPNTKNGKYSKKVMAERYALAKKYGVSGFPTIVMLDHNGKVLGKHGYLPDSDKWFEVANKIVAKAKS